MTTRLLILGSLLSLSVSAALAQAAPPAGELGCLDCGTDRIHTASHAGSYNTLIRFPGTATWPQLRRLRKKQRDFFQQAARLDASMHALLEECQRVVAENQWPAETSCDLSTLHFTLPIVYNAPAKTKENP